MRSMRNIYRAATALALLTAVSGAPAFAQGAFANSDEGQSLCREHGMPSCRAVGDTIRYPLRTGQGGASQGDADPIWRTGGASATVTSNSAWSDNGNAAWIFNGSNGAGNQIYRTAVRFDTDPYFYDWVQLRLRVGADNRVVAVRVNGETIPPPNNGAGNGGIYDFQEPNFESYLHRSQSVGEPWVLGCNVVEVEIYNEGGPSGVSISGGVQARCSRCTSPRPERASD